MCVEKKLRFHNYGLGLNELVLLDHPIRSKDKNHSWLVRTRLPALGVEFSLVLQIACVPMITLVLVLGPSFGNQSIVVTYMFIQMHIHTVHNVVCGLVIDKMARIL